MNEDRRMISMTEEVAMSSEDTLQLLRSLLVIIFKSIIFIFIFTEQKCNII